MKHYNKLVYRNFKTDSTKIGYLNKHHFDLSYWKGVFLSYHIIYYATHPYTKTVPNKDYHVPNKDYHVTLI